MNTIVTETTEQGEVAIDVFQKLASDRILFITGVINDDVAADIAATLLLKDGEDPNKKITLFINSQGGNIRNALAICDMMNMIDAPIETVCIGAAMKEAAIILAAGTPGMRFATKNSIICVSQLINEGMQFSDLTDADITLKQLVDDNKKMMEIIAKSSKKTLNQVMIDFDRKVFMSSKTALKYGLIDKIVSSK